MSITHFELDLKEAYSVEESRDFFDNKEEKVENESRPHRELLKFEVNDIIVNFNQAKNGQ
jgi:hypothetical protein